MVYLDGIDDNWEYLAQKLKWSEEAIIQCRIMNEGKECKNKSKCKRLRKKIKAKNKQKNNQKTKVN